MKSYPHDTTSYTEGLAIDDGRLFESTGAVSNLPHTKSVLGIVDFTTGKLHPKVELDKIQYFGEGITFLNGKIFQLTYKNKVGFVYNAATFKKINEFTLPGEEGWGLTTDGVDLIMSDGTNKLTYINPDTLQATRTILVTENGWAKYRLNDLEYIKGYIYANTYGKNTISKIDPQSGKIVGQLDLSSLAYDAKRRFPRALEMNGIAHDPVTNKIYLTGKFWPKIYVIRIID
jgi:glutamine cyclotransferase